MIDANLEGRVGFGLETVEPIQADSCSAGVLAEYSPGVTLRPFSQPKYLSTESVDNLCDKPQ